MSRPVRQCLAWMAACFMMWPAAGLVSAAPAAAAAKAQLKDKMLDGTWIIDMDAWPEGPGRCSAYLPPGTRLRVQVLGPNRLALEEGRSNELGGLLTLLPAWPEGLCQTALGQQLGGGAACANEAAARQHAWRFDVDLTFEKLDAKAMAEVDQAFLREQGAKAGARTVLMVPKQSNVAWRLWLRHPDEMVAQCVMSGPGDDVQSVPMRWKRVAAGR
ncbi:MAG: hypothetical protein E6Q92_07865 [Burkholderiaceae bacterium]|nr:MAG: hypothetical protein E6Q92_07865 [Burkholderiaceae bacterium]